MKPSTRSQLSVQEILDGLKARDSNVIRYVYRRNFPSVKMFIFYNSGIDRDAEDVFQDAMVIIYKKIILGKLQLNCSFETYFFAICKNLWFQRLEKNRKQQLFYDDMLNYQQIAADNQDDSNIQQGMLKIIFKHFLNLNEKSRQLLTLYANGTPHRETAEIMGYSSENYVKTRKFICKERLRKLVMGDPGYQRLMLELVN